MKPHFVRSLSAVVGALALGGPAGMAQVAPSPSSEKVTQLEAYTVSDVPISSQILPTVRPVSSVLGDDASILDIPRSVATVNKAWMDDRMVTTAMDFDQFSAGVYSPARYGIPSTPQIRGDNGQIYVDGQETLYFGTSVFPSFNGVEAMDIVMGPGSAVYGPQGNGPGGYVNLVMKQPYFDAYHTSIDATLGSWTSGRSYFNPQFTVDTGGPLSDRLAFRVSYLSRYGDGYYENEKNETQDVFAALTFRASRVFTLEWWGQYYGSRFDAVTGGNRVTEQFIEHGTYIGGSVTAYPDPPPYGVGAVDGSYAVLDPSTAYTVKLPAWKGFVPDGDIAVTGRFQSQLVATLALGADQSLVNRTYIERTRDREFTPWGYDEYVPLMESIQDRLEYHGKFETAGIGQSIVAGGDFRYTRIVSYQDDAIDPLFDFDLYQSAAQQVFPGYAADQRTFGGGYTVPGNSQYGAYLPGNSANSDAHIYDAAVFAQDTVSLGKRFSTVAGLRFDRISADDASPSLVQVFDPVTGAIYNPGIPIPRGYYFNPSDTVSDPSYFVSLVFKASETRSFYVTYDRVDAIQGSENFGGLNVSLVTDGANSPIGVPADYHNQLEKSLKTKSTLYEAGYKESWLHNTLYISADIYQQMKVEPQIRGAPDIEVKTSGVEASFVYQPNKAWTVNGNVTYQDVTDYGSLFFQLTNDYLDGYPVGFIVDGQSGTGNGSPNFSYTPQSNYAGGYVPPGGRMRAPGVPQVLANLFAQYEFPDHLGIGLGPQIDGRQDANDQGTLHIPTQCEIDGYLYFRRKLWELRLNLTNLTNARLLDPTDVTFAGNDTIYVRPPISASLTLRLRF